MLRRFEMPSAKHYDLIADLGSWLDGIKTEININNYHVERKERIKKRRGTAIRIQRVINKLKQNQRRG